MNRALFAMALPFISPFVFDEFPTRTRRKRNTVGAGFKPAPTQREKNIFAENVKIFFMRHY
jgi:hypothetical protein